MSLRKIGTAAAVLLAAGGLTLTAAGTASASSTGCAFSNGCATLHGTDANGSSVAMDAKHKNKTEIVIGYGDNAGDAATSWDGVLHYTHAKSVTTWDDSAADPVQPRRPCVLSCIPCKPGRDLEFGI